MSAGSLQETGFFGSFPGRRLPPGQFLSFFAFFPGRTLNEWVQNVSNRLKSMMIPSQKIKNRTSCEFHGPFRRRMAKIDT